MPHRGGDHPCSSPIDGPPGERMSALRVAAHPRRGALAIHPPVRPLVRRGPVPAPTSRGLDLAERATGSTPRVTPVAPGVFRVDDTCAGLRRARGPGPHRAAPRRSPHGRGHRLRLRPGARPSGRDGGGPDHRRADDPPPPRPGPGAGIVPQRRGSPVHVAVDRAGSVRGRRRAVADPLSSLGDYNVREDRFSLLDPVPVHHSGPRSTGAGPTRGGGWRWSPPPGTPRARSATWLERDGRRLAFTGDLIYAPGKVWSLAATQWSYTDNEGPALTVLSCLPARRTGTSTCCCPPTVRVMDRAGPVGPAAAGRADAGATSTPGGCTRGT